MADQVIRAVGIRDGKIYVDGGGVLEASDQVGVDVLILDDDDNVAGVVVAGHTVDGQGAGVMYDIYPPDASDDDDPARSVTGQRRIDADMIREILTPGAEVPWQEEGEQPTLASGDTIHGTATITSDPVVIPTIGEAGSDSAPSDEEPKQEEDTGQTVMADDPAFTTDPALVLAAPNGKSVDKLVVRFAGQIGLERWQAENVKLMRDLQQGREVTLTITATVDGVAFDQKRDQDNILKDLVQSAKLGVHTLQIDSVLVDNGWGAATQKASQDLKQASEEHGLDEAADQPDAEPQPDLDGETPGIDPSFLDEEP